MQHAVSPSACFIYAPRALCSWRRSQCKIRRCLLLKLLRCLPSLSLFASAACCYVSVPLHRALCPQVHFLFQEELVSGIAGALSSLLAGANASRTFSTQTLLPLVPLVPAGGASFSSSSSAAAGEPSQLGLGASVVAAARQRPHALGRSEVLGRAVSSSSEAIDARTRAFTAAYEATAAAPPSSQQATLEPEDGLGDVVQFPGLSAASAAVAASASSSRESSQSQAAASSSSSTPAAAAYGASAQVISIDTDDDDENTSPNVKVRKHTEPGSQGFFFSGSRGAQAKQQALLPQKRSGSSSKLVLSSSAGGSAAPSKMVRVDESSRSLEAYLVPRSSSQASQQTAPRRTESEMGRGLRADHPDGDGELQPEDGGDELQRGDGGDELQLGDGGRVKRPKRSDSGDGGDDGAEVILVDDDADEGDDGAADDDDIADAAAATASSAAASSASPTRQQPNAPNLLSILELRAAVTHDAHAGLASMLSKCAFVGLVDNHRSLIQHNTRLLLLNHVQFARELFYQRALALFARAPRVPVSPPVDVGELMRIGVEAYGIGDPGSRGMVAAQAAELLASKAAMLREYFSIGLKKTVVERPQQHFFGAGTKRKAATAATDSLLPTAAQRRPWTHPMHAAAEGDVRSDAEGMLGGEDDSDDDGEGGVAAAAAAGTAGSASSSSPGDPSAAAAAAAAPSTSVLLTHLPLLLENHSPCMTFLPEFLLSLAFDVDWGCEKPCFHSVCQVMAAFYARLSPLPAEATTVSAELEGDASGQPRPCLLSDAELEELRTHASSAYWVLEKTLLPAFRNATGFAPPRKLVTGHHVVQVACVEQLYRIFERC